MARLIRLLPWLRRRREEREIPRELACHLALETRQNIERGMPPGEAARVARATLGNTTLITEDALRVHGDDVVADEDRVGALGRGDAGNHAASAAAMATTTGFGIGTSVRRTGQSKTNSLGSNRPTPTRADAPT